jgi:hypothetical protein
MSRDPISCKPKTGTLNNILVGGGGDKIFKLSHNEKWFINITTKDIKMIMQIQKMKE